MAAQILAQVFSLADSNGYTRTRHFDLQGLFKRNNRLSKTQEEAVGEVTKLLDLLVEPFRDIDALRNRAITVSTVLLALTSDVKTSSEASELAEFINVFLHRLKWQIGKGLSVDSDYHYLTEFQRSITQASAESSSVAARAEVLKTEFNRWRETKEIRGDADWKNRNPCSNPDEESGLL